MRSIVERIEVSTPPSLALAGIERYLESKKARLEFVVPLKELGLPVELGVERNIIATFAPKRRNKLMLGRKHEHVDLDWRPEGGGPYPTFKGRLTIRPSSGKTELELKGQYEPPFGALGAAFDAVVGWRLAEKTAKAVLAELAGELSREFGAVQAAIENSPHATRGI
jgi:hypothetical protein